MKSKYRPAFLEHFEKKEPQVGTRTHTSWKKTKNGFIWVKMDEILENSFIFCAFLLYSLYGHRSQKFFQEKRMKIPNFEF